MKQGLLIGLLVTALAVGIAAPARAQTYGAAYTTAIAYQNLSSTATATVKFSFYNEASGTAIDDKRTLAPNATDTLNVGSLSSIASGFKGSAVMASDQPVAAVLVQLPPSTIASKTRPVSDGLSAGSSTVLIGTALKAYFSTTSIISVQNTDSVDNDFAVSFYAAGNTTPAYVDKTAVNIPPGAAKYYDLGALSGLGSSFNGSAVVVATKSSGGSPGSAVATVMELATNTGGKAASAFEGAASGGTTVYMPSAMCQYSAALNNSNFALQNTSPTSSATATTTFSPGGVVYKVTLGPYSKASVNACTAGNAAGWLGAATITSTLPIIAIGKISGGGLSTAFLGFTPDMGASTVALPYIRWASLANYDNGTKQRTFITIQNIGDSTIGADTVKVKYYDANGVLVSTHTIGSAVAKGAKAGSNPNHADTTNTTYEFGYTPSGGGAMVEGPAGSKLGVVVRASSKISAPESAGEDYNGIAVGQ